MKRPALPGALSAFLAWASSSACSAEPPITDPQDDGRDPREVTPAEAQAPAQLPDSALAQMSTLREWKRSLTPVQQKISGRLLLEARRAAGGVLPSTHDLRATGLARADGRVRVEVSGVADRLLLNRIEALGGSIEGAVPEFDTVLTTMPVWELEELAKEPGVFGIEPALGFATNKIDTSEGDVAHHADVIRGMEGVDGSGVTVGVLSDGVDTISERQSTLDLPVVAVLPGQEGSGDEGTAMLEIVHDLAPGAALMFATAHPSRAQFALNILNLRASGCDVIVDDVFYFAEASFQDDLVARAVEAVVADGALYFSSAGNGGNLSQGTAGVYEGDYVPADGVPSSILGEDGSYLSVHEFSTDLVANTISRDSPFLFTLEWSDPLDQSSNDYDLFLLSSDLSTVVDAGMSRQTGTQDPFEYVDSSNTDDQGSVLVVAHYAGSPDRYLRINTHRGRLAMATNGQVSGHAAAANAFAIGAVDVDQALGGLFSTGDSVEWFSADGPRRMFFDEFGNASTPTDFTSTGGVVRSKPDFAAADGVSTSTPGFNPFHGTSAAAPHAAALAALVLEARPDIRAQTGTAVSGAVREAFLMQVLDIEEEGPDELSGLGTLMADAAAGQCLDVVCVAADDCHDVGVCDPETGECSNPIKADGATCDDGDACTRADACEEGSCVGGDPVVCAASDQCHTAGTCNPATGSCSNPNRPNWTGCDDGNACTQADRCLSGECRGLEPVVCSALDSCHEPGTCHPGTGICSNVPKPDRTPCDDGDACTEGDTCGSGSCAGFAVVCEAVDQCHDVGTCDPATGACSTPLKDDGADCDDGNACTRTDSCRSGACVGGESVVCEAPGQCRGAGTCNPEDGLCSDFEPLDDVACSDDDACTRLDRCQGGVCVGGDPVACEASDQCHVSGTCDPTDGTCSDPLDPEARDTDDDRTCDAMDDDDDGDGVADADDVAPRRATRCRDVDEDGCDDCALRGLAAPEDDGPDFDADGTCDEADPPAPSTPEDAGTVATADAGAPPGDAGADVDHDAGRGGGVDEQRDAGGPASAPEPDDTESRPTVPRSHDAGGHPVLGSDAGAPSDDSAEATGPDRDAIEAWLEGDAGAIPGLGALVPDGGIVFRAPLPSCTCELERRRVPANVPLVLVALSFALTAARRARRAGSGPTRDAPGGEGS